MILDLRERVEVARLSGFRLRGRANVRTPFGIARTEAVIDEIAPGLLAQAYAHLHAERAARHERCPQRRDHGIEARCPSCGHNHRPIGADVALRWRAVAWLLDVVGGFEQLVLYRTTEEPLSRDAQRWLDDEFLLVR